MRTSLDHAHIFASDLSVTIAFFQRMFDAVVVWDEEAAGVRNVRLRIGHGFLHVYEQPPKVTGAGVVHHLGIETENLEALVAHLARSLPDEKPRLTCYEPRRVRLIR